MAFAFFFCLFGFGFLIQIDLQSLVWFLKDNISMNEALGKQKIERKRWEESKAVFLLQHHPTNDASSKGISQEVEVEENVLGVSKRIKELVMLQHMSDLQCNTDNCTKDHKAGCCRKLLSFST